VLFFVALIEVLLYFNSRIQKMPEMETRDFEDSRPEVFARNRKVSEFEELSQK
jgi:hypothetical protein